MEKATILAIAVRSVRRGPMKLLDEATAIENGGLAEDIRVSKRRGITLLDRRAWETATAELGVELPWYTRRANVLVENIALADCIGQIVRLGEVVLKIHAETEPCEMMDEQYAGLRRALTPDCRAGVYGQVIQGGTLRVGDLVEWRGRGAALVE